MTARTHALASSTRTGNTDRPGQIANCRRLLDELAPANPSFVYATWTELKATWAENTCTEAFVSSKITELNEAKFNSDRLRGNTTVAQIPDGRYALVEDVEEDLIKFYRVVHTDGRYNVFAYASDKQHPVRSYASIVAILNAIEKAGVHESEVLFGQKSCRCYRCGRRLTRPHAREAGIGDDCLAALEG